MRVSDIKLRLDYTLNQNPDSSTKLSCEQLQSRQQNGEFLIDLDGRGKGHAPFKVFCDFKNNITKVKALSEMIEIGYTNNQFRGKGLQKVKYETSVDQLRLLIDNSGSCYQIIKVGCKNMPYFTKDKNYAWWLDFKGNLVLQQINCVSNPQSNFIFQEKNKLLERTPI